MSLSRMLEALDSEEPSEAKGVPTATAWSADGDASDAESIAVERVRRRVIAQAGLDDAELAGEVAEARWRRVNAPEPVLAPKRRSSKRRTRRAAPKAAHSEPLSWWINR
jgi:hypothetical protein